MKLHDWRRLAVDRTNSSAEDGIAAMETSTSHADLLPFHVRVIDPDKPEAQTEPGSFRFSTVSNLEKKNKKTQTNNPGPTIPLTELDSYSVWRRARDALGQNGSNPRTLINLSGSAGNQEATVKRLMPQHRYVWAQLG